MYSALKQEDINGPVDESLVYRFGLLDLETLANSSVLMYKTAETNYKEAVRANSHYYIHPEEIMAENFKLLLLHNTKTIPTPMIKYPDAVNELRDLLRR